jgi:hypothetical protein
MNGWKKMVCRVSVGIMFFICSISSLFAEQQIENKEIPSMDFLEFLGEWETEQGEWIDPIELENEEVVKLIETKIDNEN